MKTNILTRTYAWLAALATLTVAAACNEKSDNDPVGYEADSSVAITSMTLKANREIMNNLDSVFFSVDLKNAVVYNADSLPMGTDVSRLIPVINYSSGVSKAIITMEGGKVREGEVDYTKNPSDSIDFTGKVSITLTGENGLSARTYRLKVNVHTVPSDSLMWTSIDASPLPSRHASPIAQKSVMLGSSVYTLVLENDLTATLAKSGDETVDAWSKQQVTLPEDADIRTFTTAGDSFYIIAGGTLYTSPDATTWQSTGKAWVDITGAYGNTLAGVTSREDGLYHTYYPENYKETPLEAGFPVTDHSNMGVFLNRWSTDPVGLIAGGFDVNGNNVNALWAFDGTYWAQLAQDGPCSIFGAMLIPYYAFRSPGSSWQKKEFSVWMLLGGSNADGTPNRTVWLSYDNGVHWQKAVDSMQLPDMMPDLTFADALVIDKTFTADLSDAWTRTAAPRRVPYYRDGYDITWQCPYIYIFGGINGQGTLNTNIYRGVLNRLTFTPLF